MQSKQELFHKLSEDVVYYKDDEIQATAQLIIDAGLDPLEAILQGLNQGILQVGELYEQGEYFIPELLLCADTMELGMQVLTPHISKDETVASKGTVLLGTVQGDVHDIGKNLVKRMLEVNAFNVIDLGVDVPLEKFVTEQNRTKAPIVALSAMMTTTMKAMEKVIPMIKEQDPETLVIIGGALISPEVAELYGADGYADSAAGAVKEVQALMDRVKLP